MEKVQRVVRRVGVGVGVAMLLAFCFATQGFAVPVDVYEGPDPGYKPWNHPANVAAYNAWRAAIVEMPDFREDWEGNDELGAAWVDNRVFDVLFVDTTGVFPDAVSFSNGPATSKKAQTDTDPGSTDALDTLAWDAHEDDTARMNLPNGADYIGFYIFDIDHGTDVFYKLEFTDNSVFTYEGLTQPDNEGYYRFVGFVNTHPTAQFKRLGILASGGSHYGVDNIEWGRRDSHSVPEPTTLLLLGSGVLTLFASRRHINRRRIK